MSEVVVNKYRTHSCGELREGNIGETVTVAGWVATIRDLGSITFVDLRDHYGLVQLVVDDSALLAGVNKETVISATGLVRARSSANDNIPTGHIEIAVESVRVLGKSNNVLPFEINDANNVNEELRLRYRYLDLRNPDLHKKIMLRSKLLHEVRAEMHSMGFTEVQTPILTSSSPEGARDFLVPSRLNPGKFYALPQSPQQFKQLLMVSGFDKYYQIAPCFRDEDARADRSPGEFYQMDMEMSFATQEDVFKVVEQVLYNTFKNNTDNFITPPPFERIPYKVAMDKYCSDKPDLRNPLIVVDASSVFAHTECNIFKDKTVKVICANVVDKPRKWYDGLETFMKANEARGLAYLKYADGTLSGSVAKFLSEQEISGLMSLTSPKENDVLFIICDNYSHATKYAGLLRNKLGEDLGLIDQNKFHFCWIVDFPFYEWDEEKNCVAFSHNPFSMPQGGMDALCNDQPLDILAYQYDCVLNGVEMASGAVRNHEPEIMKKAFEIAGYDGEVVENKFPALYNAFQYGAPPHAGLAFGFDRVVMFLAGVNVIRDVIAFPFNKNAQDLLMNAPNEVFPYQLKDVHIEIKK